MSVPIIFTIGQAASVDCLCITPRELQSRLGEFGHYCPVSLALHKNLVDCTDDKFFLAEFRARYYKLTSTEYLKVRLKSLFILSSFEILVVLICLVTFSLHQHRHFELFEGQCCHTNH